MSAQFVLWESTRPAGGADLLALSFAWPYRGLRLSRLGAACCSIREGEGVRISLALWLAVFART
jgi:hypothetical protein